MVYGGGWPEMRMARAIEDAAKKTPGVCVSACVCVCWCVCFETWRWQGAAAYIWSSLLYGCCYTVNGSLLTNDPSLHHAYAHPCLCQQQQPPTGKKSLAMEAFARALRQLPATIADNAGLDSAGACLGQGGGTPHCCDRDLS